MDKTAQHQEQEIDELRKSAQFVHALYSELNDLNDPCRDQLPLSFFRALASLTLERANSEVALEDIRFTAKELAEKVIELGYVKKKPKQEFSDWVRINWSKLEEVIQSRKLHLQDLSQRLGGKYYPWIEKEESKGGQRNFSYYFLIAKSFNEKEKTETKQYPCPVGGLRYVQESLTNIPQWARWVNGFTLQSWRKYAYILPGILMLLFTLAYIVLILLVGLYTEISTVKWLSSLIASLGLAGLVFSSPLYRVAWNRIVMAPDWMMPLKETNVQLELKRVGIDPETGNAIRELRLMVYSAKCLICEGRVEVQGGGIKFPFRLVGRCIESPREHVFSFDHVTRIGKPLIT